MHKLGTILFHFTFYNECGFFVSAISYIERSVLRAHCHRTVSVIIVQLPEKASILSLGVAALPKQQKDQCGLGSQVHTGWRGLVGKRYVVAL